MPESPRDAVTLSSLRLRRFRSWLDCSIELPAGLAVLHGPNGAGKTNILEACACLLLGTSPRVTRQAAVIMRGEATSNLQGRVAVGAAAHERTWGLGHDSTRTLRIGDSPVDGPREFRERSPAVVFFPERLLAIRGAPARRRALIDRTCGLVVAGASDIQRNYVSALNQRNTLLRGFRKGVPTTPDRLAELDAWTQQLAERGAAVRAARAQAIEHMQQPLAAAWDDLTGRTSAGHELHLRVQLRGENLAAALTELRDAELRRGSTLAGPHLDDIRFMEGERDLRREGSTGEQRTALLSWVLAEVAAVAEARGIWPALLLDDPLAELDPERTARLLSRLAGLPGTVLVTAPELPAHMPPGTHTAFVEPGTVGPWLAGNSEADDPESAPSAPPAVHGQ